MRCKENPSAVPSEYSIMHENNKIKYLFYLIIYMNRSYSDYINITDEVKNIEQVIITDNKIKHADIIHWKYLS